MAFSWKHIEVLADALSTRGPVWRVVSGVIRSRYFMTSAGFYLLVLLIIGGYQVSQYADLKGTFEEGEQLLVLPPPVPPPPPPKTTGKGHHKGSSGKCRSASIEKGLAHRSCRAINLPAQLRRQLWRHRLAWAPSKLKLRWHSAFNKRKWRVYEGPHFPEGMECAGLQKSNQGKFTIFKAKYQDGD